MYKSYQVFSGNILCFHSMVMLPEASKAKMFAKCVFRINLALVSLLEKIELPLHTNERKAGANRLNIKVHMIQAKVSVVRLSTKINLNKEVNLKSSFESLS